jgi:hypothetical protein
MKENLSGLSCIILSSSDLPFSISLLNFSEGKVARYNAIAASKLILDATLAHVVARLDVGREQAALEHVKLPKLSPRIFSGETSAHDTQIATSDRTLQLEHY